MTLSPTVYATLLVPALFALELVYFAVADRFRIVDKPNARSSHTTLTRRGGGVIFTLAAVLWAGTHGFAFPWFLGGLLLIAGISFADDLFSVSNRIRLLCHFAAFSMMFHEWELFSAFPWTVSLAAFIFCVGIINAYNFMDGINGITGAYSLAALGALAWTNERLPFAETSLIWTMIAAVAVFCFFNFRKRALCFAGDVGSVAIAFAILFFLGKLMIETRDVTWIAFLLVYGVDSVLTIIHRLMLRENIGQAHRKHLYQILSNELRVPHVAVSALYFTVQSAISAGFIVFAVPAGTAARWIYLAAAGTLLSLGYILFMKKYFHLHAEKMNAPKKRIWLSPPHLSGSEEKFLTETLAGGWIAPAGENLDAFERKIAEELSCGNAAGTPGKQRFYGVAVNSGTAAIHLGLLQLGVGAGDEVICQSFTFAASANPVVYCGGVPVFVDSEEDTWNMDPALLEKAILDRKEKTGKLPKAIVPVHLYGMPAKMDEICAVAEKYGVPVLEDAAEALGSEFRGRKCGTFGEFAAISFNGNKVITTSSGGIAICRSPEIREEILKTATQARENRPYYHHEKIGYNYRMSNVCAGIGRAQAEALAAHVARRRDIHALYAKLLAGTPRITVKSAPSADFNSNFWLTCILVDPSAKISNMELRERLAEENIESRLLWKPMHMQPVYAKNPFYGNGVSEKLFARGLCLPSGSGMTDADVERVAEALKTTLK